MARVLSSPVLKLNLVWVPRWEKCARPLPGKTAGPSYGHHVIVMRQAKLLYPIHAALRIQNSDWNFATTHLT